jgi:hypothetical protein
MHTRGSREADFDSDLLDRWGFAALADLDTEYFENPTLNRC